MEELSARPRNCGALIMAMLTGQLSIPPLVETGTIVDLLILIVGLCIVLMRTRLSPSRAANGDIDSDG